MLAAMLPWAGTLQSASFKLKTAVNVEEAAGALGAFQRLRDLSCHGGADVQEALVAGLTGLTSLKFFSSRTPAPYSGAISALTNLQELCLLGAFPDLSLVQLPSVTQLEVTDEHKKPPRHSRSLFRAMPNLRSLTLSGVAISADLPPLQSLETLDFDSSKMEEGALAAVAPRLRVLRLREPRDADEDDHQPDHLWDPAACVSGHVCLERLSIWVGDGQGFSFDEMAGVV